MEIIFVLILYVAERSIFQIVSGVNVCAIIHNHMQVMAHEKNSVIQLVMQIDKSNLIWHQTRN